ncbi:MAG TPA: LytTR family DNA-binding domain-containing protein [Thermoanaerobaculia bacterium]|nr:LytTR family DNA-binding domain-containing protein [Thermoanaerobaculia bacterium]
MRIVIAEDEATIARRVARLTTEILGDAVVTIASSHDEAVALLAANPPDLLILDLNLNGDDGFALLRHASAEAFDTIVVSAHTDRALEAFEYGVRDFVPKPFDKARLERAFERISAGARNERPLQLLGVRGPRGVELIAVDDVVYIRGAGTRSELVLRDGRVHLHDKLLDRLERALPPHFERVHKSFIVDVRSVTRLVTEEGSRYAVILRDGTRIPVGRTRLRAVRALLV